MKTQNTLENGGSNQAAITQIQTIKLGLDVHADSIVAVRILDGQSRQHAQRFKPDAFLEWIQKMPGQAERVYTCYEAGPFGYCLHRKLIEMGVTNHVVRPRDDAKDSGHVSSNFKPERNK